MQTKKLHMRYYDELLGRNYSGSNNCTFNSTVWNKLDCYLRGYKTDHYVLGFTVQLGDCYRNLVYYPCFSRYLCDGKKGLGDDMWFRYLVTFIDVLMILCIFFSMRGLKWKEQKFSVCGFGLMMFSYIASIALMWL